MSTPILFKIRVTDDDRHAIFIQDFDAFEEAILYFCLEHLNEELDFSIMFVTTPDDSESEISYPVELYPVSFNFDGLDDAA